MSGGIAQLVAIGAQDAHLVENPQISFFRSNFKRHTNFSTTRQRQIIQGTPAANNMSTVRFERKGDLLSYTYLVNKLDGATVVDPGKYIDHVELYIGGQLIDSQDPNFSQTVWPNVQANTTNKSKMAETAAGGATTENFYPLHFFFCDDWTTALPLVALQYHDVELRIYWNSDLTSDKGTYECWSNFIYLDDAERKYFADTPQNMVIKQVQSNPASNGHMQDFSFNHPIAYIAVADTIPTTALALGADGDANVIQFSINGTEVGDNMEIKPHYNEASQYYHSTVRQREIFVLPFGLNLSAAQPSGTLNFSRLDSARLQCPSDETFNEKFYAVNYNVLKIENGMAGLLFAN
jgi:hypothetical protein